MLRSAPAPHRAARRWRVTPPLTPRPSGAIAGLGVLEEIPGELGGLLWRTLQTVSLWSAVPVADRRELFTAGAHDERLSEILAVAPDAALEAPLFSLQRLLDRPEVVPSAQVGLACTRVAQWAGARGAFQTQFEFVHAAAGACPGDAALALAVGRVTRDRGEYPAAEAWYQRAIGLARQAGDWESYARAWAGLGKLAQAKGAYPSARKSLLKALRAAERRGLREPRARVLHELFTVEIDCRRDEEAERYAEASLKAYGSGHHNLLVLAGDVAIFWLDRGRFDDALAVLLRILPHFGGELRLVILGNVVRAAGAVGDGKAYEAAFQELSAASDDSPRKIDAMQAAVHGAISLGRLDEAELAARRVLETAITRGENKTMFMMEALLEQVRGLRHTTSRVREPAQKFGEPEIRTSSLALHQTLDRVLPAGLVEV